MTITAKQLVEREVIYCVSTLVHELMKDEKYQEDLFPVASQDDWLSAARDAGYNGYQNQECAREYCDENNIDPQITEAYEHWIITDWMADKLEARGEMVLRDFMGLTIWGRACTGQMICMDSVIEEICADLNKEAA